MRRTMAVLSMVMLLSAALGATASAQTAVHPNVGTWITGNLDDPADPPSLTTIGVDGTVETWSPSGPGTGTWEPTGERSFRTTIVYPATDPEGGYLGATTLRIEGEVSEDGQSASGTYTLEFPGGPDGPPAGEYGPVPYTSTKMTVEGPGEVVGPWPPAE